LLEEIKQEGNIDLPPFYFFQHVDVTSPFAANLDLEAKAKLAEAR
jgi:hypothetical protein